MWIKLLLRHEATCSRGGRSIAANFIGPCIKAPPVLEIDMQDSKLKEFPGKVMLRMNKIVTTGLG